VIYSTVLTSGLVISHAEAFGGVCVKPWPSLYNSAWVEVEGSTKGQMSQYVIM
jgi:hypothetical protein